MNNPAPLVHIEHRDRAVIVTIDNPPVNTLTHDVANLLSAILDDVAADPDLDKLVLTGAGKFFIAGADIREIQRITRREIPPDLSYLNELLNKIENLDKLVVAAINGPALGIGLETALACHYRVIAPAALVGLPEVKLGLIPGAGGTQRLPRLTPLSRALHIIESGEPLNAREALHAGIVDQVAEGDLLENALALDAPIRRTSELPVLATIAAAAVYAAQSSPTFVDGLSAEASIFEESLLSPLARRKVYLFFAERDALRLPATLPAGTEAPTVLYPNNDPEALAVEVVHNTSTSGDLLVSVHSQLRREKKIPILVTEPIGERLAEAARSNPMTIDTLTNDLLARNVVARPSDLDVLLALNYGLDPRFA